MYARASTLDQEPAMQVYACSGHCCSSIAAEFIDQVSDTTAAQPALEHLWQAVRAREVDTILV
jgi:DNA invertase Pin-like site-specific DNA recombinase